MPSHADIAVAADRLRRGGVVAFPTETVYGLGADAFNEQAVRRVFELKGRPPTNPLIVHITGRDMARSVVSDWSDAADRLARALWPGPLTLVLPKAPALPAIVTSGGPTAAVRSPDHPVALALLFAFGGPLVGPSANPSGRISPTRAEHVRESFPEDLGEGGVLTLDAGPCPVGLESTVLDLTSDHPRILRRGVIGPHAIADILGLDPADIDTPDSPTAPTTTSTTPLKSPGLLTTHYAPNAPTILFTPDQWPAIEQQAAATARRDSRIALITHTPHSHRTLGPPHAVFTLPDDPAGYAATIYDAMRQADALTPALIAIERPPHTDPMDNPAAAATWAAVHDRLARATRPL